MYQNITDYQVHVWMLILMIIIFIDISFGTFLESPFASALIFFLLGSIHGINWKMLSIGHSELYPAHAENYGEPNDRENPYRP